MHELSITQSVVDAACARAAGRPVRSIRVRVGALTAVALVLALALHSGWALAAAAVVGAAAYGLLGMVMTRPAAGVRAVREALVAAVFGMAGGLWSTNHTGLDFAER